MWDNRRKKELISASSRTKLSYNKLFSENLLAIEIKKKKKKYSLNIKYLGLSILELSKIVMYEFCYNYVNPKYG